jgi:hypothetical protein
MIREVEHRLGDLRDDRRKVKRVLDALHPPEPKPEQRKPHRASLRSPGTKDKKRRLTEYIRGLPGDADITARSVNGHLGVPASPDMIRNLLRELHSDGIIRVDRAAQGGGMIYRQVNG